MNLHCSNRPTRLLFELHLVSCDQERCVQIGSEIISPVLAVRDRAVYLDSEQHVSRSHAATCFFHLRRSTEFVAASDATQQYD
jgi:hypothetical protein